MEMRGRPARGEVIAEGKDFEVAQRLWEISEELTEVTFGLPNAPR